MSEAAAEVLAKEWIQRARCAGTDTARFYPTDHDILEIEETKKFCRACPVQEECLDYALAHGLKHGIWGGTSERDRRRLRRTRKLERTS